MKHNLGFLFNSMSSSNFVNPNKVGYGRKVGVSSGVDMMRLVLIVAEMDFLSNRTTFN